MSTGTILSLWYATHLGRVGGLVVGFLQQVFDGTSTAKLGTTQNRSHEKP